MRSWKFAEEQQNSSRNSAKCSLIAAEMQSRYVHAAQICGAIRTNFAQLSTTSQIFLQQIDSRLQGLLNGYARLLSRGAATAVSRKHRAGRIKQ